MTRVETENTSPVESQPQGNSFSEALPESSCSGARETLRRFCVGLGLFLLVLGVYVLTSPGRIDTIDGEARFDVARSLVVRGQPIMTDPLIGPIVSVPGRGGFRYSYYGAPASVFAAPLVWLGLKHALTIERAQFLFSLTSSIFGAAIAALLFLFYLDLAVGLRKAVLWTLVSSFATLVWPVSNSSFDNSQNAFLVLAALYCACLSVKRCSSALAIVGGLCAGVLILYQEYFVLLVPCFAFATLDWKFGGMPDVAPLNWSYTSIRDRADDELRHFIRCARDLVRRGWDAPGEERSSCVRYALFAGTAAIGVVLALAYNDLRFGSWLNNGKGYYADLPLFGNPVMGFLTLLASPGKSIFLYSPPIILGILGFGRLRSRTPVLAKAIVVSSIILILFFSCISFAGGDWCWGPRYLVPLLPLFALAFPFANLRLRREAILLIVALGLVVQALALSVENERFFNEEGLTDHFWMQDPGFYLTHSALLARIGEVASLPQGPPATARHFTSAPLPTYSVLGAPHPREQAAAWIRNFQIFFLPRPWPFWMPYLPPAERPVDVRTWLYGVTGISLVGAGLTLLGLRAEERV